MGLKTRNNSKPEEYGNGRERDRRGAIPELYNQGAEDYEHLLDDYSHFVPPAENEVLQGRVLKVTPKDVIVDFAYKSEGIVPLSNSVPPQEKSLCKPGDMIDVMVDHEAERVEGYVTLSHQKADAFTRLGRSGRSA